MNIQRKFKSMAAMLLMLFIVFSTNSVKAQLQVTQGSSLPAGWTIDSLVQNVLVGTGVEVTNVQFNGSAGAITCNAIGSFTTGNTPTNLGITSGIIMGTGGVSMAAGNNTSGSSSATSGCTPGTSSELLNLANGNSVNDCAVLEFDFVPLSDSIKFRYVFASEEYPEFVCSNYNDIFGFFLTGLNPNGGIYSSKNIALIPGTEIPIAINHVNGGTSAGSATPCYLNYSQYYVNNQSGTQIQYDGFTTVLTAEARVVPCQTYHLKMCIADLGDGAYDSGVFLEANSLTSNPIQFEFTNTANPTATSDLYEGCEASIKMIRPNHSSSNTRIDINFSGTASNGVDFAIVNPYIYFPANQDTFVLSIQPYMDNVAEGIEYAKFVLSAENGCPNSDSVQFNIIDTDPLSVHIERDTLMNMTAQIQLRAVIEGGMPNRIITWTNLTTGQVHPSSAEAILVPTSPDARWLCSVQDMCGNYGSDTMLIGIRRYFARISPDTIICAGEPLTLGIRGADSCVWYRYGEQQPFELYDDTVYVQPTEDVMYKVYSYITWNGQIWEDVDSVRIVVVQLPEVHVSASPIRVCEGQSTTITASGSNQYSWDGGTSFVDASSHTYTPDTTTMYVIYGLTAGAECYGKDSVLIIVDTMPVINLTDGGGVCGGENAEIIVTTTAETFNWVANPPDPSLGGQESNAHIIVNPSSTTVYTVNASNGVCYNSNSTTVAVEPQPVARGEVSPKTVSLGNMEAVFTNLSEHSTTCKWEFPYGEERTEDRVSYVVPDDVDSVTVRLWAYNPYQCFDTTSITVYVDHSTVWAPNAFTPEESTNNTFAVKMNDVQRYHILIYDRRGQIVFESFDQEKAWDGNGQNGQKCPVGVYTYIISCHKITHPYDQIIQKGTVVLIR